MHFYWAQPLIGIFVGLWGNPAVRGFPSGRARRAAVASGISARATIGSWVPRWGTVPGAAAFHAPADAGQGTSPAPGRAAPSGPRAGGGRQPAGVTRRCA
ncbi:hypothetical protein GCM10009716_35240 [Streptomyces sodiiphilus]|uniref:Uncharacterized protein n=1 Tax=Streptomyces sodiiphilus TaxID=226217 RepID=A0ABN2PJW8_9ACTN